MTAAILEAYKAHAHLNTVRRMIAQGDQDPEVLEILISAERKLAKHFDSVIENLGGIGANA